jgi:hypothetical protein
MTRDHRRAHLWAWLLIAGAVAAVWVAAGTGGGP